MWPGKPYPLGANWDGEGVNFALFSEHADKVELCLFDPTGRRELHRVNVMEQTEELNPIYGSRQWNVLNQKERDELELHLSRVGPEYFSSRGRLPVIDNRPCRSRPAKNTAYKGKIDKKVDQKLCQEQKNRPKILNQL